jgi:hypothetical protein
MSNSMWNVNSLGIGTVVMLALALPAGGVALASHLAVFEARACTGLSQLQEGSYEYEQRLAQCMRDGRTLPAK